MEPTTAAQKWLHLQDIQHHPPIIIGTGTSFSYSYFRSSIGLPVTPLV
jgi:hypothetical protein